MWRRMGILEDLEGVKEREKCDSIENLKIRKV